MITKTLFGVREIGLAAAIVASVALFGASVIHAETTYTPPAGYSLVAGGPIGVYYNPATSLYFYSGNGLFTPNSPTIPNGYATYAYGTYYNQTNGMFYNPVTGQYTKITPLGPAAVDANGAYIIPNGYTSAANGSYYNSTTGLYYDPRTGFYSTTVPANVTMGGTPTTVIVTPGVPNTGAGGEADKTIALLVMTALIGATGVTLLRKREARG